MGIKRGPSKAKDDVYVEVTDFLNNAADKTWKQTGIGDAFVKTINKGQRDCAGLTVWQHQKI